MIQEAFVASYRLQAVRACRGQRVWWDESAVTAEFLWAGRGYVSWVSIIGRIALEELSARWWAWSKL